MRKYIVVAMLLSLTFLANCGDLKVISNADRAKAVDALEDDYKLVGNKIVRIDTSVNSDDREFVTSSNMFTVKKDVQPFVTSEPMFKVIPRRNRKSPKIFDKGLEGLKPEWFKEVMANLPDGYNVNRYKLKEDSKQEVKPKVDDYVGGNIGEGEIDIAYDNHYFEDPSNPDGIGADIDTVGIDSSIENEFMQVPDYDDLSEEYIAMLGDDADKYEIIEDVSGINGEVAEQLFFSHGSAKISKTEKAKIINISKNLSELEDAYRLSIVGHASKRVDGVDDPRLKREINFKMAKQRADKVSNEFKKNGIDSKMLLAVSKGDEVPNPNTEGKSQEAANRRVDIFLDAEDYYY